MRSNNFYAAESRIAEKFLLKYWCMICSQSFVIFQFYDSCTQIAIRRNTSATISWILFPRYDYIELVSISKLTAAVPALYPSDNTIPASVRAAKLKG